MERMEIPRMVNASPIPQPTWPAIVIPAEVLFNNDLTCREKLLFGFLTHVLGDDDRKCRVCNRDIGQVIGVRADTVSGMLSKLRKLGYIKMEYKIIPYDGSQIREITIDKTYPKRYHNLVQNLLSGAGGVE